MRPLAVYLSGRHPVVLEGFRAVIERTGDLEVGGYGSPDHAPACDGSCDVFLLHVNPRNLRELDSVAKLVGSAGCPILAYSLDASTDFARRVLALGVHGYLARGTPTAELVQALRVVAGGGSWVSALLGAELASELDAEAVPLPHQKLSDREFEVLVALAGCDSPTEIAGRLCLSEKTVRTYRARIARKLGLDSSQDLVRYAMRHNLAH